MIQINTCSKEDLRTLPKVGPATAQKIVDARPIEGIDDLEKVLPPSAWLALQESDIEVAFASEPEEEAGKEYPLSPEEREELAGFLKLGIPNLTDEQRAKLHAAFERAYADEPPMVLPIPQPPVVLVEHGPMALKRLIRGRDPLKDGARYVCLWNIRWGPAGESYFPADESIQSEIEGWFEARNMKIQFAHYGQSVRVRTSKGHVPLLLFEIIEKEESGDGTETESNGVDAGG